MRDWEWDVIWMSLVVFIPSLFALGLLLFPRGREEGMRRWSLLGTLLTMCVSFCMFIQFRYNTIEQNNIIPGMPEREYARNLPKAGLEARAWQEETGQFQGGARSSDDWIARYSWIPRFNIEYLLGADGISVAL